jgi:hypothetical protein
MGMLLTSSEWSNTELLWGLPTERTRLKARSDACGRWIVFYEKRKWNLRCNQPTVCE